jgi:predicted PurR-regulated permease PerM
MPRFEPMDQAVGNPKLEAIYVNPRKIELASNYVIRWKHMSIKVRICAVIMAILLVCFGLFVVAASVATTILIPYVAVSADEANTDVDQTNKLVARIEKNLTKTALSQLALMQRIVILERDNTCYHTYADSIINGLVNSIQSAQQLKNCLDGIIS